MKWKPRMDESLRAIEGNEEASADVAFAFQVRLQLLAQKAIQFREEREWDFARTGSDAGLALSVNFYIRTLQAQLLQLSDALPPMLQERGKKTPNTFVHGNKTPVRFCVHAFSPLLFHLKADQASLGALTMHKHYIELCVSETARSLYFQAHQGPRSGSGGMSSHDAVDMSGRSTLGFYRLDFSWRSLGAIKAWMGIFFSLSPADCAGLSFIHMAQLARCLVVLYRLSMSTQPGWDCNLVRNEMDVLAVLEGVARHLELASSEAGEQSPDDQFMHLAGLFRKFYATAATRMEGKLTVVEGGTRLDGEELISGCEVGPLPDQALLEPLNIDDDTFLNSIFGDSGNAWSV